MKVFAFIDDHKTEFSVKALCQACEVPRSSYYDWAAAKPSDSLWDEAILANRIFDVWVGSRRRYGAPRVCGELWHRGGKSTCLAMPVSYPCRPGGARTSQVYGQSSCQTLCCVSVDCSRHSPPGWLRSTRYVVRVEWAALVISVVAIGVSGFSVWFTCEQSKAAKRSAAADEEIARIKRDEVDRRRILLELYPVSKSEYHLMNNGTHDAYDVTVDPVGNMLTQGPRHIEVFPANHFEPYLIAQSGNSSRYITVSWHATEDRSDSKNVKRLPLR